MTQEISRIALNKNLSVGKLSSVGRVSFKGGGVQGGVALKKSLVNFGGRKTERQFEKQLMKEGVSGSQLDKRKKILELAYGNKEKITGLTDEQIARNLRRSQRDRIYAESGSISRGEVVKQYAGGRIVKSFGVRGTAKDIGVDRERAGKIGFAGNYQNNKLPDNAAPKMPPGGIKPIGLMNN